MRAGIPLLLAVLREETLAQPASANQWREALALAAAEGILPSFVRGLQTGRFDLPLSIENQLADAEREAIRAAFWWTSELRGLLAAFAAAGIPVLPLKGPMLAERLHADVALRPARDLDLLIRPTDAQAAGEVLRAQGFLAAPYPEDYQHAWTRNSTLVELHTEVENPLAFNFHTAQAFARAEPSHFHGQPALRFTPADELLYLCLHGVRHRFERLSHSLDIAQAHAVLEVPALLTRLANVQALGLAMAAQLFPRQGCPDTTVPHLKSLALKLWHGWLDAAPAPLTWQTQHRFYLELEPTPQARIARRLRHAAILATRVIDQDYAFAARLHLHSRTAAQLLRPIRLITQRSRP
jgi:hypothetical protein